MQKFLTNQLPDRTVVLEDGKKYLWFSGTDYLGMGHNEEFRTYLNEGFSRFGTHFGSSRNNSLQLPIFSQTEEKLAAFFHAPDAITVSSGMWAGQLLMKEIENIVKRNSCSDKIQFHYAPGVHPALWGNHYVTQNDPWNKWAVATVGMVTDSPQNLSHIICTDSVGSPRVEEYDFSIFKNLPAGREVWLIVDDSHGIGVTGESGNGIFEMATSLENDKVIVTASLNKAMGIPAGIILAEKEVTEQLRASPWFSGASPFAPAYSFALNLLLTNGIYQQTYEELKENIRYFKNHLNGLKLITAIDDYPVFCSENPALFQYLLDKGIMASCFPYPLSTDLPTTRLAITARHKKEDLNRLAEVCKQFEIANPS
ncbi:aminotransferase class I/II-fold pyridoxal phosphate-dependent enzyme [Dyadobacter psychrotolerans]|uniref:Aminotransferase class I/II-fold pyridoxal phosphate-dependent enzyme n=1 Tax=Dyadobacter psychrotolerans TaxID=2541721 RepID=A0A4R5DB05_9BACT|nr:aminotransferase class I/II-fold pyridoxal phosphate-dependent enzyme [Dyadobacter psychrotolerans]TDE10047.1 aminotransferase class I/II-fold pyridoxal phosphate-dependent enzyme [Dyadobacter psychrotolerans]